jgi:hypothetical protein
MVQITKPIFKPSLAAEFFAALRVHQHLERLDLDCVSLGMELGAKLVREVLPLPCMPKLKILDLKVGSSCSNFCSAFFFAPSTHFPALFR